MNITSLFLHSCLLSILMPVVLISAAQKLPITKISDLRVSYQQLMKKPMDAKIEAEICRILEQLAQSANFDDPTRSANYGGLSLREWVEGAYSEFQTKLGYVPNCAEFLRKRLGLQPAPRVQPRRPQPARPMRPVQPPVRPEEELTPEEIEAIAGGGGGYQPGVRPEYIPSPRPRVVRAARPGGLRPEEIEEEVAKIESMYPGPRPGPRPRPRPATPTAPEREEAVQVEEVRPGMRRTTPPPSPRPMPRRPSPTPTPRMRTPEPSPRGPTYCPAPGFKPEEENKRKAREYEPEVPEVPRIVPGTPRRLLPPLPEPAPEPVPEAPAPRPSIGIGVPQRIEEEAIPERKPTGRMEIPAARPRRFAVVERPKKITPAESAELERLEREGKLKKEKEEKAGKESEAELITAVPGEARMIVMPAPAKREIARTIPSPKPITLPSPIPSVHEEGGEGEAETATLRARKKLRVVIPEEEPGEERKRVAAESPETPGTSRSLEISEPGSRGSTTSTIAPITPRKSAMRKPGAAPSGKKVAFEEALEEFEAPKKESARERSERFAKAVAAIPTPKEDPKVRNARLLVRANTLVEATKRYAKYSSNIENWRRFGPSGQGWQGQPIPTPESTERYFKQLVDLANNYVEEINKIAEENPAAKKLAKYTKNYADQLKANVDKYLKSKGK